MLLSEAKRKMREAGYKLVKEDLEDEAEENKTKFFRQPKRLSRVYTGIEDKPADIDEEMNEDEFYSLVSEKVKGMAELYKIELDEEQLESMCFEAYDRGMSVKEAFKQIWLAVSTKNESYIREGSDIEKATTRSYQIVNAIAAMIHNTMKLPFTSNQSYFKKVAEKLNKTGKYPKLTAYDISQIYFGMKRGASIGELAQVHVDLGMNF